MKKIATENVDESNGGHDKEQNGSNPVIQPEPSF
jgi:hypothetical protein